MNIEIVNPVSYPHWDDLLLATPGYTFFHTSLWSKVISESYRYTPIYFMVSNGDKFLALIPVMEVRSFLTGLRGVSLPFTDLCDPLINEVVQFEGVYNHIVRHGKELGWKSLEFRGGQAYFSDARPSKTYYGHILRLSENEETIYSGFMDNARRNVRKAIKEGVETKVFQTSDSVKEFYRLNCLTRKQHGLPPQPYRFFKKVQNIISSNSGFAVLASYQQKYIAGAVFFHFGKKAVYKYGASDRKYLHLRPNNLVMWEAIRWYCKNGYESLSFGRTDIEHQGLRQFKTAWGTKEFQIKYYKQDLRNNAFMEDPQIVSTYISLMFRKMPITFLKILGSLFYRHMG